MKTIILDDWDHACTQLPIVYELKKVSEVIIFHDKPTIEQLKERVEDADFIIPLRERTRFSKEILHSMKQVKLIAQTGTGIAHIDINEATKLNIPIATSPGGSISAVTELTFAFILSLSRNLVNLSNQVKEGLWPSEFGANLRNKTLGIIGLGKIGSSVAAIAKAFGMNVIAWGPTLTKERAGKQGVEYVSLEQLLQDSHFISLHLRLTKTTENLLQRKHFEMMRTDSYLINTARGKIIDENALIWALQTNRIKGAGLDVFPSEPVQKNHPLLAMENVILAPHIGWRTDDTYENFLNHSIHNILNFINGKSIQIVNK